MVIALTERVAPGRCALQSTILKYYRSIKHMFFLPNRLQAIVGPGPDAILVQYLTFDIFGPTARTVALVLRALRLRAEIRDVWK